MDYKKELLLYLYENNSGYVEIFPISEKMSVTNSVIKDTIKSLKKYGLIDTDESYRGIGGGNPSKLETVKSLHIKASITPPGEQYVRDTYMKNNDNLKIKAKNLVFANGDINAPMSQANDHSSSQTTTREIKNVMIPKKTATKKGFWDNKYAVSIVSGIIVALISYLIINHFN